MKTFENMAAQGDVLLIRIKELPATAAQAAAEGGEYIVGHSETGHSHVVAERPGVEFFTDTSDPLTAYLRILSIDVALEHKRSFDTHETISIKPGTYKIRRQREHTAEGWRRAQD